MLEARTLLESGRLREAIESVNQAVKAQPADSALRTFLFELLCFTGDLDRARKQLDVIATQHDNPAIALAVQVYQQLLTAEATRRQVFHGDGLPKFVGAPPHHVELYVMLLRKLHASADELGAALDEAETASPSIAGTRGSRPFSSFRDADDRVAAVLEVFHGADYLWVPLDQISRLEVTPPKKLRELMWAQARVQVGDQPMGDVFIPGLYVDSYAASADVVKLGRSTEWEALHDRMVLGAGRRMFLIDDVEVSLFELADVSFASAGRVAEV